MDYRIVVSPLGKILLAGDEEGLQLVNFQEGAKPMHPGGDWVQNETAFEQAAAQMAAYFDGRRQVFDLRLAPEGTPFYRRVWEQLQAIPYGETITYGELARRVGKPNGARAVGLANGRNPLPVVIPCHRVVGADGSLTGYGGGLEIKRALLELERRHRDVKAGEQMGMGW